MDKAYIHGIGVATPGLPDWPSARPILRGEQAYITEPLPVFRTGLLPRNEARRAGDGVKLAFRVAEQACQGRDASRFAAVFSSSAGDIDIADWLCAEVNTPARAISPTRFHNSVHNAAAGYWSIATGSQAPMNSLASGLGGFAIALREAWGLLVETGAPVLLVSFDVVGSSMLHAARPDIENSFAMALLLSTQSDGAVARLGKPESVQRPAATLDQPSLERLRGRNASARSLPLLTALTRRGSSRVVIESEQGNISIDVDCGE